MRLDNYQPVTEELKFVFQLKNGLEIFTDPDWFIGLGINTPGNRTPMDMDKIVIHALACEVLELKKRLEMRTNDNIKCT